MKRRSMLWRRRRGRRKDGEEVPRWMEERREQEEVEALREEARRAALARSREGERRELSRWLDDSSLFVFLFFKYFVLIFFLYF